MAKAKAKQAAKKPAKKPAKKAAKRPLKNLGAKRAKARAHGGSPAGKIEQEVTELLAANDAGDIDNVFDIIDELVDYDKRLPKTSPLRAQWDAFFAECEQIMVEVSQSRA
jgi:hypothetical protein